MIFPANNSLFSYHRKSHGRHDEKHHSKLLNTRIGKRFDNFILRKQVRNDDGDD